MTTARDFCRHAPQLQRGKRPGYYVEGAFYGDRFHQARARANFLSQEYGRGVQLTRVWHDGKEETVLTTFNCGQANVPMADYDPEQ